MQLMPPTILPSMLPLVGPVVGHAFFHVYDNMCKVPTILGKRICVNLGQTYFREVRELDQCTFISLSFPLESGEVPGKATDDRCRGPHQTPEKENLKTDATKITS